MEYKAQELIKAARINNFNLYIIMDIVQWKVNQDLLDRILEIKENGQRPIKRGFKTWLTYIRTWKSKNYE